MTGGVEPVLLDADRCQLSGLFAAATDEPRGTLVALHGGGMNASYFDGTTVPELSLLRLGASVGWNVLSLDRPGYGASASLPERDGRLSAQAEIVYSALDVFASQHEPGRGICLVGHSYGFKLALHLAAHERGQEFLGVEGSGAARRYRPKRTQNVSYDSAKMDRDLAISLFWGSRDLYPPETFQTMRNVVETVPEAENREAPTWPESFPAIAAQVRIPVRVTLAEHEPWWITGNEELQAIAAAFSEAPVIETVVQPAAGHNISLGWAARSYHLAVLAFAERCLLRRCTP
jgi:prepilin-type processing-associated H-X9-DG protein